MYTCNDDIIRKYAMDYHINLISPANMSESELDLLHTNLREILKFIKYADDKDKLKAAINSDERFKNVSKEAVDVINIMTNSKITIPKDEGACNMCKGIEGLINDGRAEGINEGIAKGRIEGITEGTTETLIKNITSLMKNGNFSIDKAMELLGIYEDQKDMLRKKISAS